MPFPHIVLFASSPVDMVYPLLCITCLCSIWTLKNYCITFHSYSGKRYRAILALLLWKLDMVNKGITALEMIKIGIQYPIINISAGWCLGWLHQILQELWHLKKKKSGHLIFNIWVKNELQRRCRKPSGRAVQMGLKKHIVIFSQGALPPTLHPAHSPICYRGCQQILWNDSPNTKDRHFHLDTV